MKQLFIFIFRTRLQHLNLVCFLGKYEFAARRVKSEEPQEQTLEDFVSASNYFIYYTLIN